MKGCTKTSGKYASRMFLFLISLDQFTLEYR